MISNVQWSSKAVGVIAIAGVVILYAGYNMWHKSDEAGEAVAGRATGTGGGAGSSGSAPAVAAGPAKFARVLMADVPMDKVIPADLLEEKKDNAPLIAEKNIKIEMRAGKSTLNVFYREAPGSADKVPLLLLHGKAFTSKNWLDTKTIQFASRMGHRVVAVDLPGFGKTEGTVANKGKFLDTLIGVLGLGSPVIVSPSMSGTFALPFVLGDFNHKPSGYIPVAPGSASDHEAAEYKKCKVPVLIAYGSKDKSLGVRSAKVLKKFPNHKERIIEDAGHPAYIDQPAEWHRLLYNFLQAFKKE